MAKTVRFGSIPTGSCLPAGRHRQNFRLRKFFGRLNAHERPGSAKIGHSSQHFPGPNAYCKVNAAMRASKRLGWEQVRKGVGILLWLAGHIINFLTLSAAFVYAIGAIFWMHAPVPDVLQATAMMALLPLGLAWLCWRGGKRLKETPPAVRLSPRKRWLLAFIGIAVVVAGATITRRGLREYECSVDRSRNTAADEAETRRNGFERVCEGDLARFDISFRSIASATQKLAFTPVDLTHTLFAPLQSLGGKTELAGDIPSRLYRGFRTPDGHRLTLFEHDMSADGSSTLRDPAR